MAYFYLPKSIASVRNDTMRDNVCAVFDISVLLPQIAGRIIDDSLFMKLSSFFLLEVFLYEPQLFQLVLHIEDCYLSCTH